MSTQDTSRHRCLVILLILAVSSLSVVSGFSDGSKLAKGSAATRTLYCNRQPKRRAPLHFDPSCNGYCEPRSDFEQFYTLAISNATYWLDVVRVNISAKPTSGKSITGFSVYAIDESGHVAGMFVEDDTDVIVGTCNDLIAITDETHAAFHKMANHSRKNISIQWQPDGYNHDRVRFVLWVVNNHSDIYFVESPWLTSQRDGSNTLDVKTSLDKVMSAIDINMFEDSFKYRSTKGYNLDLTNPFSAFSKSPSTNDLVPANLTKSSDGSNPAPIDSSVATIQPEGVGSNGSSSLKVAASNGTSGVNDGSVLDNRDMNATKVNNVNDTDFFKMSENKLNNTSDSRMNNVNDTKTVDVNNSSVFSINGTAVGNMNDTKLYTMNDTHYVNGTDIDQVNDTSLYTINGTSMDNMNYTSLNNTNETTTPKLNDTNPSSMENNMNDTNDTIIRNLTFIPPVNDSKTTQTDDKTKLIPYTTQAPVVGNNGFQLTEPSNNIQLNAETTPISATSYPKLSDSQTTTSGNNNVYTPTSAISDLEQSGSQNGPAPGNNRGLNTSGNSLNATPLSGSPNSAGGTRMEDDGYSTTAYPENPVASKVDISAISPVPFDGPGITNADMLRPSVM